MLRASAAAEAGGIPSSSIVAEGFMGQAAACSMGLGMPDLPLALLPGHPAVQATAVLQKNILGITIDRVIQNLTATAADHFGKDDEPSDCEIVFSGSHDEVNEFFRTRQWSDSLPIVPPTKAKIEAFLGFTDRKPAEVLGIVLPDNRAATVRSIAVNGVMAGCRPEYMPILVALVQAMLDPEYGVEHSGSTPGSDTLIILNGPIIKQLGFNYGQGVLRDGVLPNTSIGRFWRLYLRNVAGFLIGGNDKATYGGTWRVVLAENEDVLKKIGWPPNNVGMGFESSDNTVLIQRYSGGNPLSSVSGTTPEELLTYVADGVTREHTWQLMFAVGSHGGGALRPLILLSPLLAEMIAAAGWSKQDVKEFLFQKARIPAWQFERILRDWTNRKVWNLAEEVRLGHIPKFYYESDDPDRLVPIAWEADDFLVAVTGDPLRNTAYVFAANGPIGYAVASKIELPADWDEKLAAAKNTRAQ
ncbi:MAG: hypothetical protein HY525_02555 [Betaproteobacteria bacterium]|nr:hypothetical protein [Betaproteobacteria bacterium]